MTVTTFYPDAHVESTSVDGYTYYYTSTSWATTRGAADSDLAGDASTPSGIRSNLGNGLGATYYTNIRLHWLFDTSSIPDGDTVSAATLSGYCVTRNVTGAHDEMYAVSTSPASNTAITTADYDQIGTTSFGSVSVNGTGAYKDITLNGDGLANITKTGVSKFGILTYYDFTNTTPDNSNEINDLEFDSADAAGTTTDPKLVVTHAADNPRRLLLLGVGV